MPGHKAKKKRPPKKGAGKSWEEALADGSFGRSLREGRLTAFTPLEILVEPTKPLPRDLGVVVVGPSKRTFAEEYPLASGLQVPSLSPQEQYVIFAALAAMVADNHTVQDQMTEAQWNVAQVLYERLKSAVDGLR